MMNSEFITILSLMTFEPNVSIKSITQLYTTVFTFQSMQDQYCHFMEDH